MPSWRIRVDRVAARLIVFSEGLGALKQLNALGPTRLATACSEARRKCVPAGLGPASMRATASEQAFVSHVYAQPCVGADMLLVGQGLWVMPVN